MTTTLEHHGSSTFDDYENARVKAISLLRGFHAIDDKPVEVAQGVLMMINRSVGCGAAIITICESLESSEPRFARLRFNEMPRSSSSLDLIDDSHIYLDPRKIPEQSTPLEEQVILINYASAYAEKFGFRGLSNDSEVPFSPLVGTLDYESF